MDSRDILALRQFPFPWDGRRSPYSPTKVTLHERTGAYASGTAGVIIRSAELDATMQRSSMFFSEVFGYCSC